MQVCRTTEGAFLLIISLSSLAAAADQVGTRGFPFLRIGVDARAVGMGSAFSAIAQGPNATDWNPAGLAAVNRPSLGTNYLNYLIDGIHAGSIGFAQPLGRKGAMGVSLRYFRVGDIPRTTEENPTGEGLGSFTSTDIALKLGLAYRVGSRFFIGAAGSMISGSIEEHGSFGLSSDFGILLRNLFGRFRVGAALRHLGSQTSAYVKEVDPLPTEFALGIARPFWGRSFLVAADYVWSADWESNVDWGIEWQPVADFFLRGGYRSRVGDLRQSTADADLTGLTFGVGLRKMRRYQVDYAYASFADLGGTHRISFTWEFH